MMQSFANRIAVITGAGSGIGRQLSAALAAQGCHLALIDIDMASASRTAAECGDGTNIVTSVHQCDVRDGEAVERVASEIRDRHGTDHVNLLINNAGIGSVEGFVHGDRAAWEQTFDVCWGGVYNCCRSFVPMVVASEEGQIVNVSSINGMWASLGPNRTNTSYSAAKFAVRGFTEALVTEMRLVAPHVKVAVVMPGHIGTDILTNSRSQLGRPGSEGLEATQSMFRETAPTSAAEAATIILDGIRNGRWRILVGADAEILDAALRADPEGAYEPAFVEALHAGGAFGGLIEPVDSLVVNRD